MEEITAYRKPPLLYAGGWRVTDGGFDFRLVKRRIIQKWRTVIKKFLLNKRVRKQDLRIEHMLFAAELEWNTYACPDYQSWASQNPLEKQQALFAWILKQRSVGPAQKGRSVVDIIASGVAGGLYDTLKPQPRHDSYARAVSIARPIWFLLRPEYRTYEHDSGHGTTRLQHVCITKKVRLRSRNCCQRIEAEIRKHAGWFINEYHARLVSELQKKKLL